MNKVKIIKLLIDCPIPYLNKCGWIIKYIGDGLVWVRFEDKSLGAGWFFKDEVAR